MNTFLKKLYSFSGNFIQLGSLLLTFLLFAGAFLCTCYSEDMETQLVLTRWDNPLWGILGAGVFLAVFGGISHFLCIRAASPAKILRPLCLLWCVCLGGVLILFGRTVPAADAMSVYSIAETLAGGDTSVIHPTESYLSYYPQQVGLTAFFEILIRLWKLFPFGVPAYHFIKCVYVGLLCVIVRFQERTVHLLWKSERADCVYLLLAGANLPFILYSSFVYGEIPSFAAASAGFYYLLKWFRWHRKTQEPSAQGAPPQINSAPTGKKPACAALAVLGLTLSVMLRKNSLILLIAALIVIALEWLRSRERGTLLLGVLCAVCGLSVLPLVQKSYELRSGSELSSGVTAASYLAMGMQESSRANGWYNGFNFTTYQDSGLDSGLANEISRQAVAERLRVFREQPGYAMDFYLHKHLSQWADGTYASRQATLATFGGRHDFFVSLYEGALSRCFIGYCNLYQNFLYLGALSCFCALWRERRKKGTLPPLYLYLGFIAVVGGFLFHILWEANSRYIFPYSLLLLPYAARGVCILTTFLNNTFARGEIQENN